ncbi:MAG TPA: heme biosynthesis HemY N-terminal domain-containing protein [Hydrogenophaga sp.]|uniref:heme biosynthesis HemY N-terminal domain-containing protein n=1 Tax=Hydrogenophaga sp. TaxID=1904254 RepID=UPI002C9453B3|nr:heme biosynthesis HemY N-terminal domain-containing protein [Hydrogenophaga sp.]HMN93543.1 heme biosynthesis HemY N-terminal domain-containing protein [Hydrogenophaga sp.]HMP10258.1 heme biosynthesis HemY N-terminal domain-containing protein [Hydrogenophaga sp.]
MRSQQTGMVRGVFVLLGLAVLAVALSLLVGENESTLTLFWSPHRVDVSFNLVLFLLVFGFGLLHLALRALSAIRDLPAQARRWRSQQQERAVVGAVLDALAHQLAGRFVRAQSSAQQALDQIASSSTSLWPRKEQMEFLAHLLLAESAQSLQNRSLRDLHLARALEPRWSRLMPEASEGALLRAVRWAVEDRDPVQARARLALLPQGAGRRIQALRLKLRVARMDGAGAEALETARLLAKHKAFSAAASVSLIRGLALDALGQAHDLSQLQEVWAGFDKAERGMPELALAAAQRALTLVQATPASAEWTDSLPSDPAAETRQWVRQCLEPVWDRFDALEEPLQAQLVRVLEPALTDIDDAWLGRLEQRQRQWPDNPFLQYLTGQVCLRRQLWGKAAQLLGQASGRLTDRTLLRRCWRSIARLAQERGDHASALQAWQKAAEID